MKPVVHELELNDVNGHTYTARVLADIFQFYPDGSIVLTNQQNKAQTFFRVGSWNKISYGTMPEFDDGMQQFLIDEDLVVNSSVFQMDLTSGALALSHYEVVEEVPEEGVMNSEGVQEVIISYRLIMAPGTWSTIDYDESIEKPENFVDMHPESYVVKSRMVDEEEVEYTYFEINDAFQMAFFRLSTPIDNENVSHSIQVFQPNEWTRIEFDMDAVEAISEPKTYILNGEETVIGSHSQWEPSSGVYHIQGVATTESEEIDVATNEPLVNHVLVYELILNDGYVDNFMVKP